MTEQVERKLRCVFNTLQKGFPLAEGKTAALLRHAAEPISLPDCTQIAYALGEPPTPDSTPKWLMRFWKSSSFDHLTIRFKTPLDNESLAGLTQLFETQGITLEHKENTCWLTHPISLTKPINRLWSNALAIKVHYMQRGSVEKIFDAINEAPQLWDIRDPSADTKKKLFNRGVIAEHKSQIIGFMFGQHIDNLLVVGDSAVRSDFRRLGIATEMLNLCIPKVPDSKEEKPLEIYVSAPSNDPSTFHFFESQKFFDEGATPIQHIFKKEPFKDLSEVLKSLQDTVGAKYEHHIFERGEIVIQETPPNNPGEHHFKMFIKENDGTAHVVEGESRHDLPVFATVVETMVETSQKTTSFLESLARAFMWVNHPPEPKNNERN